MINGLEIRTPREYQAVLGVDYQSFKSLVALCENTFLQINGESYFNSIASSPKFNLAKIKSLEELIAFTLMILKSGITFDFAGFIMQFDQSRAHRQFEKGLNIVHDSLSIEGFIPIRSIADPQEFSSLFKDIDTFIIDATEQRIQRPSDYEDQIANYSGNKKTHTYKSMIISGLDRYIHYVSYVYVGSTADISVLEQDFDPKLPWFDGYTIRVDLGYQGFAKKYPKAKLFLPHKRPRGGQLSESQKEENKKLAKERIGVEHTIGGMKRFDILSIENRIHVVETYNIILGTCAGLWNYFITD